MRRRRKKSKGESSSGCARKRKLSEEQVTHLELNFGNEHKLESERKDKIASELGLDPRQVAVWFQNRRARWKSKKLEEEFSKLKIVHESVVVEKCRLETEVPLSLSSLSFSFSFSFSHVKVIHVFKWKKMLLSSTMLSVCFQKDLCGVQFKNPLTATQYHSCFSRLNALFPSIFFLLILKNKKLIFVF